MEPPVGAAVYRTGRIVDCGLRIADCGLPTGVRNGAQAIESATSEEDLQAELHEPRVVRREQLPEPRVVRLPEPVQLVALDGGDVECVRRLRREPLRQTDGEEVDRQ